MRLIKQVLMTGVVAFSVAACHDYGKSDSAPPPSGPPDRTRQQDGGGPRHDSSACPLWNGEYIGNTGVHKRLKIDYDNFGSLRIEDLLNNSRWIVNGKPQWLNGHPKKGEPQTSYSAYCAAVIPGAPS